MADLPVPALVPTPNSDVTGPAPAPAPDRDPLLVSLLDPPCETKLQCAIYNALWRKSLSPEQYSRQIAPNLVAYFDSYARSCTNLQVPIILRNTKHWHVTKTVELLRNNEDYTKAQIREKLQNLENYQLDDGAIDVLIPLAVRIWLMISVGTLNPLAVSGQTVIPWADEETLRSITDEVTAACDDTEMIISLPQSFTARNLERQVMFEFVWTSNLADHLLLRNIGGKMHLHVFHHAAFLTRCLEMDCAFLPKPYIRETLVTLALLFPQFDTPTRRWYKEITKQHSQHQTLDPSSIRCGSIPTAQRQSDQFHYWRDRLIELKQAYGDAEPRSILGVWRDNRNTLQWWTFWIAAGAVGLTVLFGLIQSVTGVVQAWASVKALGKNSQQQQ